MNSRKQRFPIKYILLLVASLVVLSIFLPASVHAELPPRPTRTPVASPKDSTPEPPLAGTLMLSTEPNLDNLMSVVQWQDSDGAWHDVNGWRGLVMGGKTVWWVEERNWGEEPYRWVVYRNTSSTAIATSQPFKLPGSGETLIVEVDLSD